MLTDLLKRKEVSSAAQPRARDFQLPQVTHLSLVGARMKDLGTNKGLGWGC